MSRSPGGVEHPMLAALSVLEAGLDGLAEGQVWSLTDADLAEMLDRSAAVKARLAAVELAAVSEADRRGLGRALAGDTAGWLRGRLLLHPGAAKGMMRLASALRGGCRLTAAALAAGSLSAGHATVIVEAMAALPPVGATVRVEAEQFLIEQAGGLDPLLLAQAARALREKLTNRPDSDAREVRAATGRALHRAVAADGMVRYLAWLDPQADAALLAALDPLAAPRPAGADGQPDPRSPARRRADALVELVRLATTAGAVPVSGGIRPTLTVTIDYHRLLGQLPGGGRYPSGEPISAGAARRIGCDANIIPVVLGGAGQPLDIGRAARSVPPPMRSALVVRDQACAFPGCDRPAAWSEAHHIVFWADGGPTALDNLVLLCGAHHIAVHHQGWRVHIDDDGLPTFHPPPWIDPTGAPRRHHRYQLRQLTLHTAGPAPPG